MIGTFLMDVVLPVGVGIVGVVAFSAILFVRFKAASIEELREALQAAKYEIDIANARGDRLEKEFKEEKKQVEMLRERIGMLEAENALLRGTIASGKGIAPELVDAVVKALDVHRDLVLKKTEDLLLRFEERVKERHKTFISLLSSDEARTALRESLK